MPLVTYCFSIWSSHQQIYTDKLVGVQYKLLRYLAFISCQSITPFDHNYDHLCARFFIPLRNIHYSHDAIIAFNLVHNLVNSPETIDGFRSRNLPYTLRFPHQSSYLSVVSSNYAFQYSSNRLLKIWNLLPPSVRSSSSLRTFKGEVSSLNLIELYSRFSDNFLSRNFLSLSSEY